MDNPRQGQNIETQNQTSSGGGMLGGMSDKLNSAVGGSQIKGDDQSYLSKGIEAVQQSVFGKGDQSGSGGKQTSGLDQETQEMHAAVDEAHPEKISEFMRDKYMTRTAEQKKEEEGRS